MDNSDRKIRSMWSSAPTLVALAPTESQKIGEKIPKGHPKTRSDPSREPNQLTLYAHSHSMAPDQSRSRNGYLKSGSWKIIHPTIAILIPEENERRPQAALQNLGTRY